MPKISLKHSKRFKSSSQSWLKRQINDPYVHEAQQKGYRSRAAFKLLQIQERFKILKPGHVVIDLGCAPGSWCQVCREIVIKPSAAPGMVIGVDLQPVDPIEGVSLIQGDFCVAAVQDTLFESLQGRSVDVVLSDMAPSTTGDKKTDHIRIMALAEEALAFASHVLKPGGCFVVKIRQGGASQDLRDALQQSFQRVSHVKPPSSRSESSEMFVIAQGYR